ncbi:GNAT family N-acetyltransferase [Legionella pneumophila]|uniref:GNAT family N-acetyltransferase n=1 Tax=Legionella pneumophila TaxID=446 RepID=UPI00077072C6|nr:GNAT family N-acetyltransferase [Legionella pneumophila]CZL29271.1 Bifunctional AAC/APH [Legionella pneumophila]
MYCHFNITFSPLRKKDFSLLHRWFQVPHVKRWYARGETYTLKMIQEKYLLRIKSPEKIPNFIVLSDNHPIGYIQLYRVDSSLPDSIADYHHPLFKKYAPHDIAGIDLFIGDENFLHKGYGKIILTEFIEHFIKNNFLALVVDPYKENEAAINFFKQMKFIEMKSTPLDSQYLLLVLDIDNRDSTDAVNFPSEFTERVVSAFGEPGRIWLESLPEQMKYAESKFHIKVGNRLSHLSYNYVANAIQSDGQEIIVKFSPPSNDFMLEIQALEFMRGSGVVELIGVDKEKRIALLEKLIPGQMLAKISDDSQATYIAASVMKRLWKPINPAYHDFPTTQEWFYRFNHPIKTPPDFPKGLIDKANEIAKNLHQSLSELVLLHGDLHHQNILSAKRESWLAIDPKGVIGEREYEVGALLRNPIPDIATKMNTKEVLARRVESLAEILEFNPYKIIAWSFCQAVLAAIWCLDETANEWKHFIKCAVALNEIGQKMNAL